MKIFLIIGCLMLANPAVWAEEKAFLYDEHGRRDPFWPLVSDGGTVITYDVDLTASDMVLEGIVAGGANKSNMAIINGKVVKPKDTMGAYTVDVIADDYVEILKDTERFTLKLKKGGS